MPCHAGILKVMISFGAVLGKASPLQLMCMALFEVLFHSANETIGVLYFGAVDMGTVRVFRPKFTPEDAIGSHA
jgi:hypothetical protein